MLENYHINFPESKVTSFMSCFVWLAPQIYSVDSLIWQRKVWKYDIFEAEASKLVVFLLLAGGTMFHLSKCVKCEHLFVKYIIFVSVSLGPSTGDLWLPHARSGHGGRTFRPCGAGEAAAAHTGLCYQMWTQTRYMVPCILHATYSHRTQTDWISTFKHVLCSVDKKGNCLMKI